jgi:hypothetical protein
MTRAAELELALLAIFLDAEEDAVASHETCTYPGGVFNDAIWRERDPAFPLALRARRLLSLRPFCHRDKLRFGKAGDRLAVFRKAEKARLK